jgi:hypothetical protein
VVYYVLALCLFFGDAYEEVMRLLASGLLFTGAWREDWQVPTTGAIAQARQRPSSPPDDPTASSATSMRPRLRSWRRATGRSRRLRAGQEFSRRGPWLGLPPE